MKLLIAIVNYRTPGLVIDALASIAAEGTPLDTLQTVVVDNDSADESVTQIEAAIKERGWESWARVHYEAYNRGFAAGNNAAIRPALAGPNPPDYVLLLNSDTVVRPGAIRTLVEFLAAHPQVGIAGSRLEHHDATPQCSAYRFPTILGELDEGMRLGFLSRLLSRFVILPPISDTSCPIDWVAGASMLVRREVFEQAGLLDEGYFLYYEEVDFCLRAARAGWPCWYVPESRVVHLVGASSGVTNAESVARPRPKYWFNSRRRYFIQNHGLLYAAAVDVVWSLSYALWSLRARLQRKDRTDPPRLLLDYLCNSVFVKGYST